MEIDCSLSTPTAEAEPTGAKSEVSVIVPVYNVEPYLRRCIDSLVNQTLQNIEIILIDDGSTDGCGAICDEYTTKDTRIRVVHQENVGLSEARNSGIDRARADFLMFVDSDDWVEPEFCELPLMLAKKHKADLVMFQFRYSKNGRIRRKRLDVSEGIKTQKEALGLLASEVGMMAWNKLYHRELFRMNRYPKGKVYEDIVLTPVLVHFAQKIVYSTAVLYNQEYRAGSITTIHTEENARNMLDAISSAAFCIREWGYAAEVNRFYQSCILRYIIGNLGSPELTSKCLRYLHSLKPCPPHFSMKQRCEFYLLRVSPRLFRLIYNGYHLLRP
jgi:Glycosyltransferases involved in cell wall biogenesis